MKICVECGELCEPHPKGRGRCRDCYNKMRREASRAYRLLRKDGYETDLRRLFPVSAAELAHAHKKPASCSDVRWRIELRRRRDARYYSAFGDKP